MNDFQIVEHYGEISRVLRHVRPLSADQVAEKVIQLYRRHSTDVTKVMDEAFRAHASDIREGKLPATCAILLAIPESYKKGAADATRESSRAPVDSSTPTGREGSPPPQAHGIEEKSPDAQQSVPDLMKIEIPSWLKTAGSSEKSTPTDSSNGTEGQLQTTTGPSESAPEGIVASRPQRKRGRPTEIPDERKQRALAVQGGKARAQILYATKYPTPQQVKNVSSILKHYLGKSTPKQG
jgi:hypothetical protein